MEQINLRSLRLWHWRRTLAHRNAANMASSDRNPGFVQQENERANFHLGCVQCLNEYVTGTADTDERLHPELLPNGR